MNFKEHFTKLMKERGASDKQIAVALFGLPFDDHELTEDEMKGMKELADICKHMPAGAEARLKASNN